VCGQRETLKQLRSEANPRNQLPNLSAQYALAHKYGGLQMELVPLLKQIKGLKVPLGRYLLHIVSHSSGKK
jgi:hypothetical protein